MESRREFLGHRLFDATALAAAAALPAGLPAQTESSRQIRMGVVGGGFGTHFDWHEHPNSTVAAVTDLRAGRRDALQTKYRCDTVYNSLEEMLRRPEDLDAVAIFSGAPDHFKHVSMCMERGLHVISAVPAVMTLEEADGLRDLKERTGLRYMMAETSYYRQPTIYARNLHAESGFGEVFYTELEYYHDRGDLEALLVDKTSRFYEPDGSRTWRWGLPPMHYPTHCLGFLVGVTKERIERVSCLGWGGEHAWLEDNRYDNPYWCQSALMQTDRGNMSRCNVFWFVGGHGDRPAGLASKDRCSWRWAGFTGMPGCRVRRPWTATSASRHSRFRITGRATCCRLRCGTGAATMAATRSLRRSSSMPSSTTGSP